MAFVCRDHLVGVEIKSSRDTLDRLKKQRDVFERHIPEVWLAVAPCWADKDGLGARGVVIEVEPERRVTKTWSWRGPNLACTAPMLDLLWRDELAAVAARKRLDYTRRAPIGTLLPLLARKLTGDEIVIEVCRELRSRDAFWKADPPEPDTGATRSDRPTELFDGTWTAHISVNGVMRRIGCFDTKETAAEAYSKAATAAFGEFAR